MSESTQTQTVSDADTAATSTAPVASSADAPQAQKRTYVEELHYFNRLDSMRYQINQGFVPNMSVPAVFYANEALEKLTLEELFVSCAESSSDSDVLSNTAKPANTEAKKDEKIAATDGGDGLEAVHAGFIPAVKQLANVATLPGIVGASIGLPDLHCGYGFAVGHVAAFDMNNPDAIVSPGGVGFDINCGVRMLTTGLLEKDLEGKLEMLADLLFQHIPVGVGGKSKVTVEAPIKGQVGTTQRVLVPMEMMDEILETGMDWAVKHGFAQEEDRDHCEEHGRMKNAKPDCVSVNAKKRGRSQLGTLGAGNHYVEVQLVEEIFDKEKAQAMGVHDVGQVCVMLHCGSRGLGHQVATDVVKDIQNDENRVKVIDDQLASALIQSETGQKYLQGMAAAANFAWANRSVITHSIRSAFAVVFKENKEVLNRLNIKVLYDVSHNIAKIEKHIVDGQIRRLLVHRKGATRAFGPNHPDIPEDYRKIGQPVLVGGTMGTCSYVLTGTQHGMDTTFGSTCHGAGRAMSRSKAKRTISGKEVMQALRQKGIIIRVANERFIAEEAPDSYKDVTEVVNTCHEANISLKCIKLRPIVVIKG